MQRVAVRWSLKTPASTAPIATGDYFTLQLPLTFSTEATANVLSARGTPIGVATFATNGSIRVVFNVSALSSAELPLTTGYLPFMMRRPASTGSAGSSGSGSSSHSAGSNSTGGSGSSQYYSSGSTSSDTGASSSPGEGSDTSAEATTTAPGEESTSAQETTPPATSTTTLPPETCKTAGGGLDVGQIGTIVLGVFALVVFYLAFLIYRRRKHLSLS